MVTGEPGVRGVNAARNVIKANTTARDRACISKLKVPTPTSHVLEAEPGTKSPATSTSLVPVSNKSNNKIKLRLRSSL